MTGHLPSRHPVVVGRGRVVGVEVARRTGAGAGPGRGPPLAACRGDAVL
jgi:hypothetical protein